MKKTLNLEMDGRIFGNVNLVNEIKVTIVNKGSSLTIVNETTSFIKTIILKKKIVFKNDRFTDL